MLHLRVVCADQRAEAVLDMLRAQVGVVAIRRAGRTSHGVEITADLARECGDQVLAGLRGLGVFDAGMATLEPLDTAIGILADQAERDAPGEGADALIWDELVQRTGADSTLTGTFVAFMILATLLAAVGVVTDSQVRDLAQCHRGQPVTTCDVPGRVQDFPTRSLTTFGAPITLRQSGHS
jgi:hypothetical protein